MTVSATTLFATPRSDETRARQRRTRLPPLAGHRRARSPPLAGHREDGVTLLTGTAGRDPWPGLGSPVRDGRVRHDGTGTCRPPGSATTREALTDVNSAPRARRLAVLLTVLLSAPTHVYANETATVTSDARAGLSNAVANTVKASTKHFTLYADYQQELPLTVKIQSNGRWEWSNAESTERLIGNTQYARLPDDYLARGVLAKKPLVKWYRTPDQPVPAPKFAPMTGPLIAVAKYGDVAPIVGGYQVTYQRGVHTPPAADAGAVAQLDAYDRIEYEIRVGAKNRISFVRGTETVGIPGERTQAPNAVLLYFTYNTVSVPTPASSTVTDAAVADAWPALPTAQRSAVDTATDANLLAARARIAVGVNEIVEASYGVEIAAEVTITNHSRGLRFTAGGRSWCSVVSGKRAVVIRC
jgi:hypothetical protein